MKLATFFFFLSVMAIAATSYSQNTGFDLNVRNATIIQVFDEIERVTDFGFLFKTDQLDLNQRYTLDIKSADIGTILNELLDKDRYSYRIIDRNIVITRTDLIRVQNQDLIKVSGRVTDAKGLPLPGVTIVVKGTTQGTITDASGSYSLSNVPANGTLAFSFVGMETQEAAVNGKTLINVMMEEGTIGIDEVVAVGYGTQKRSDIAGAIASIKVEALNDKPSVDLQGVLKGMSPGLYVTNADSRPGGNSNVLIRGLRSLKGENSPLYVVDGFPISDINDINIDDIQSISVLKDAASSAIYGARGANGVILITSRKGTDVKNKVNVSYQTYYSIQNVDPNFEIFSPEEFVQLKREVYRADRATAQNNWEGVWPDDNEILTPIELDRFTKKEYINWTDYAFKKNVPLQKHDVSVSGGNEKTKYSISLGYFKQEGLRMSSGLKRYSGKISLDQKISDTFKTGLSVYYVNSNQEVETNSWISFLTFSPLSKLYDEFGELILYPTGNGTSVNPLYYEKTREYFNKTDRVIVNSFFEITPVAIPGLKYKLNASLNKRRVDSENFKSFEDPEVLGKGYASANFSETREYLLENIISYTKTFFNAHNIDITLMQGVEPRYYTSTAATALQLGNDFFDVNSMSSSISSEISRSAINRKMLSYMGRLNYSFKNKYLFNFTMRSDGSSVFGANNKWGLFPSAALAWNIHNEPFMKKVDWLDETKLRVSYGQIGNQAISPYGSLATADNSFYVNGDQPVVGYLPGTVLPNPDLQWETTTTFNAGVDFALLGNRLSGSIEIYKTNTTDLLVSRAIPQVLGYSTMPSNLGEVQNKGLEVAVTGYIISSRDFSWSVSPNFSINKNKLVKGVLQDANTGEFIDDIVNNWFIGSPINVDYDYKFAGIWQLEDDIANSAQPNARPGDIKVVDVTKDGTIYTDDRVIIKKDPKWIGSLFSTLKYKRFELSAHLYTVQGTYRSNEFLSNVNYGGSLTGSLNGIKRDYWTPENPSNRWHRPHDASNSPEYRGSAGYQDASYLRLRNVTFSWDLPVSGLSAIGLSKVRLYLSGENLWTKTNFWSYSPEASPGAYPEAKSYMLGINVNF
ncbi:MAG: TonB-dependent receptor [Mangrovibacterium sp.]